MKLTRLVVMVSILCLGIAPRFSGARSIPAEARRHEVEKAFAFMGSGRAKGKTISIVKKGPTRHIDLSFYTPTDFRWNGAVLEILNRWGSLFPPQHPEGLGPWGRPPFSEAVKGWGVKVWVPVTISGRSFEYTYRYAAPGLYRNEEEGVWLNKVTGRGEIVSFDPLRTKTIITEELLRFFPQPQKKKVYEVHKPSFTAEYLVEFHQK
jgi:hypothetical protein